MKRFKGNYCLKCLRMCFWVFAIECGSSTTDSGTFPSECSPILEIGEYGVLDQSHGLRDFFFWVYVNAFIYETRMESEMDLVARIAVAAGKVADNLQIFECVRHSILKRYQSCIDVGGGHFRQLLQSFLNENLLL